MIAKLQVICRYFPSIYQVFARQKKNIASKLVTCLQVGASACKFYVNHLQVVFQVIV